MLFSNPFCHSTVAFRRTCFDQVGGYNSGMRKNGDYELWGKMLEVCRAGNIPVMLVRYRMNSRGLTANNPPNPQRRAALRRGAWARLGVEYDRKLDLALDEFTAGSDIGYADLRTSAYRAALVMFRRFLAAPRPMPRGNDDIDARRVRSAIIERVLGDRSIGLAAVARLWPLCWRLDRRVALKGAAASVIGSMRRKQASWLTGARIARVSRTSGSHRRSNIKS
jgi:hypothetical protein